SYGIYGPAFELMEQVAREPGSGEYFDSEKYEIRSWAIERADSLRDLIALVNRIRRANPALQSDRSLAFMPTDNEQVICYAKRSLDGANTIVVVVGLDPHHAHGAWLDLDLRWLGVAADSTYQMHDLLSVPRYLSQGARSYVRLDPAHIPAHVCRVGHRLRREQHSDYRL